jgi:hypothetical protein
VHPIQQWQGNFLNRRGSSIRPVGRCTLTGSRTMSFRISKRYAERLGCVAYGPLRSATLLATWPASHPCSCCMRRNGGAATMTEPDSRGNQLSVQSALPTETWNQSQRSECVEKGLQGWKLRVSNSHGLRYLGSIAFQGGLPMCCWRAQRGLSADTDAGTQACGGGERTARRSSNGSRALPISCPIPIGGTKCSCCSPRSSLRCCV